MENKAHNWLIAMSLMLGCILSLTFLMGFTSATVIGTGTGDAVIIKNPTAQGCSGICSGGSGNLSGGGSNDYLTSWNGVNNLKSSPLQFTTFLDYIGQSTLYINDKLDTLGFGGNFGGNLYGRDIATSNHFCGDEIPLKKGWNAFGISPNVTKDFENVTIELKAGLNLIAYSADTPTYVSDIIKTDGLSINVYSPTEGTGDIVAGNQLHVYKLYKNQAYWVDASQDGDITFIDVRGSEVGSSYAWSDLMFEDETTGEVKNITDAFESKWITVGSSDSNNLDYLIWFYGKIDPNDPFEIPSLSPLYSSSSLDSWQGYFIWSRNENLSILRQDYSKPLNSTCGGEVVSYHGYFNDITVHNINSYSPLTLSGNPINLTGGNVIIQNNVTALNYCNSTNCYKIDDFLNKSGGTSSSSAGNPFDQVLNTTNSPTFRNLTLNGSIVVNSLNNDKNGAVILKSTVSGVTAERGRIYGNLLVGTIPSIVFNVGTDKDLALSGSGGTMSNGLGGVLYSGVNDLVTANIPIEFRGHPFMIDDPYGTNALVLKDSGLYYGVPNSTADINPSVLSVTPNGAVNIGASTTTPANCGGDTYTCEYYYDDWMCNELIGCTWSDGECTGGDHSCSALGQTACQDESNYNGYCSWTDAQVTSSGDLTVHKSADISGMTMGAGVFTGDSNVFDSGVKFPNNDPTGFGGTKFSPSSDPVSNNTDAFAFGINNHNFGPVNQKHYGIEEYLDTRGSYGLFTLYVHKPNDGYEYTPFIITENGTLRVGDGIRAVHGYNTLAGIMYEGDSKTDVPDLRLDAFSGQKSDLLVLYNSSNILVANISTKGIASFGGGSPNHAVCWKADGKTLGYCSDAVNSTGGCTCV